MVEESVQADMEDGADMGGDPYFDFLPVHKLDEDVDFWFGMAVQASCHPYLPLAGKLQMFLG